MTWIAILEGLTAAVIFSALLIHSGRTLRRRAPRIYTVFMVVFGALFLLGISTIAIRHYANLPN
jgi:hypothetical protein